VDTTFSTACSSFATPLTPLPSIKSHMTSAANAGLPAVNYPDNGEVTIPLPKAHTMKFVDLLQKVRHWTIGANEARELLRTQKSAKDGARLLWKNLDQQKTGVINLQNFLYYFPSPQERACRAFFLCLPTEKKIEVEQIDQSRSPSNSIESSSPQSEHYSHFMKIRQPLHPKTVFPTELLENQVITKREFINSLLEFSETRKRLSCDLTEWHNVSDVLHSVSSIFFWLGTLIVLLLLYTENATSYFLSMTTLILSFSFIFGNTVKTTLEAFLYIFVTKPYSIGDKVELRSHLEGELEVDSIQLLTTTFLDVHNKKIIVANSVLSILEVYNLSRSQNPTFTLNLDVSNDTSTLQLSQLRGMITNYLNARPTLWTGKVSFFIQHETPHVALFKVVIRVCHIGNWQNPTVPRNSVAELYLYILECFKKIDIRRT
jgi:hypothetical protein